MNNGSKSLNNWVKFFKNKESTNIKFLYLLKNNDLSFLTQNNNFDFDDEKYQLSPDLGFLEETFKKILYESNQKDLKYKTMIALAIYYGANLTPWKKKYGDDFSEIISSCLVTADYEQYGIKFEKILKKAIEKNFIDKRDFAGIAILRGFYLTSKYTNPKDEKILQKNIIKNKIKLFFGFLLK